MSGSDLAGFKQAFACVCHDYRAGNKRGVQALRAVLDRPLRNLYRKADPSETETFPAVNELVEITRVTGDPSALDALARACGRMTVPVPEMMGSADDLLALILLHQKEHGDFWGVLHAAMDPEGPGGAALTTRERADLVREGWEAIGAMVALIQQLGRPGPAGAGRRGVMHER